MTLETMVPVSISAARAGHVLGRPVLNTVGLLLAPAGLTLTEDHLQRFRAAGVKTIEVQPGEEEVAAAREQQRRQLATRFAGHEDDPLMMGIKAIMDRRIGESAG